MLKRKSALLFRLSRLKETNKLTRDKTELLLKERENLLLRYEIYEKKCEKLTKEIQILKQENEELNKSTPTSCVTRDYEVKTTPPPPSSGCHVAVTNITNIKDEINSETMSTPCMKLILTATDTTSNDDCKIFYIGTLKDADINQKFKLISMQPFKIAPLFSDVIFDANHYEMIRIVLQDPQIFVSNEIPEISVAVESRVEELVRAAQQSNEDSCSTLTASTECANIIDQTNPVLSNVASSQHYSPRKRVRRNESKHKQSSNSSDEEGFIFLDKIPKSEEPTAPDDSEDVECTFECTDSILQINVDMCSSSPPPPPTPQIIQSEGPFVRTIQRKLNTLPLVVTDRVTLDSDDDDDANAAIKNFTTEVDNDDVIFIAS